MSKAPLTKGLLIDSRPEVSARQFFLCHPNVEVSLRFVEFIDRVTTKTYGRVDVEYKDAYNCFIICMNSRIDTSDICSLNKYQQS